MKKRILSILLCLCMVLMLCPVTAFAEEPTGSLAITVDGFEVGKTPNDCTYSFESTIPGVTFSEDDIQYIGWHKYAADGDRYPISDTDAFRADTQYWLTIDLANNGLRAVPTVTVNGNTPYYCTLRYSAGVPGALSIGCDLGTPAEPPAPSLVIGDVNLDGEVDVKDATMLQDCLENPESFEKLTTKQRKAADYNEDDEVNYKDLIALRSDLNLITINGPDVVCAQQDYEFTVTPPAGVTLDTQFGYNTGSSSSEWDRTIDENGVGHGVVPKDWYNRQTNSFTLTARGTDPSGNTVTETKTVQVSPEHIFVDGVCGCGAVKTVTVTVPFTITVKQGGSAAPRKTVFELELVDNQGKTLSFDGVTVSGTMTTTNGKGDYDGILTITGPEQTLRQKLKEGVFVRQVYGGKANWTYDDMVWGLWLFDGAAYATADSAGFIVLILPTTKNDAGDYYIDWDSLDLEKDVLKQMTFTNIYTRSTYRPSGNGSNTGTITSPQTGDNSNLAVWFALLAVSAAGVMGAGVYSKRRRSSR